MAKTWYVQKTGHPGLERLLNELESAGYTIFAVIVDNPNHPPFFNVIYYSVAIVTADSDLKEKYKFEEKK